MNLGNQYIFVVITHRDIGIVCYSKSWLTQVLNEFVVENKEGRIILSIEMFGLYRKTM